jgi:replicative DNA helicase
MAAEITVPEDIDLEQLLLGEIMTNARLGAGEVAATLLQPDDFYLRGHSLIFQSCLRLMQQGIAPDFIAVRRDLKQRDELHLAGGDMYILDTSRAFGLGINGVEGHALKLLEYSRRRQVIQACLRTVSLAANPDYSVESLLHTLGSGLEQIAGRSVREEDIHTAHALAQAESQRLAELFDSGKPADQGIPTGWSWVDSQSGGFVPGDLWIWAARPNVGKTRLLLYSLGYAASQGTPVGFISLDMSRRRLLRYAIPTLAAISGERVTGAQLYEPAPWDELARARLRDACEAVDKDERFWVVAEPSGSSLGQVEAYIRQLAGKRGCRVVAIDQAQNIAEWDQGERDRSVFSRIVGSLKRMARRYDAALVLVHQVQRKGEELPGLTHLKGTGVLEEYSDMVVILHDPQRSLLATAGGFVNDGQRVRAPRASDNELAIERQVSTVRPVILDIAKNRNAPTRREAVRFDFSLGVKA